jgi:hypothetical protein
VQERTNPLGLSRHEDWIHFGGSIAGTGMIDIEKAKRILAVFEREGVE